MNPDTAQLVREAIKAIHEFGSRPTVRGVYQHILDEHDLGPSFRDMTNDSAMIRLLSHSADSGLPAQGFRALLRSSVSRQRLKAMFGADKRGNRSAKE